MKSQRRLKLDAWKQWISEQKELSQKQKMWALKEPVLDAHIFALQEKIMHLENEIDEILMEKIKKESHLVQESETIKAASQ